MKAQFGVRTTTFCCDEFSQNVEIQRLGEVVSCINFEPFFLLLLFTVDAIALLLVDYGQKGCRWPQDSQHRLENYPG